MRYKSTQLKQDYCFLLNCLIQFEAVASFPVEKHFLFPLFHPVPKYHNSHVLWARVALSILLHFKFSLAHIESVWLENLLSSKSQTIPCGYYQGLESWNFGALSLYPILTKSCTTKLFSSFLFISTWNVLRVMVTSLLCNRQETDMAYSSELGTLANSHSCNSDPSRIQGQT